MTVRLLPWQPEFGTSMQFDADSDASLSAPVEISVERPVWSPVTPSRAALPAWRIVDGVRRVEAYSMEDGLDGQPQHGLFGSYAVGVVAGGDGEGARILEEWTRVERRYLHAGEAGEDRTLRAGAAELHFRSRPVKNAATANELVAALNRAMLDEESLLAQELSRDEAAITLVDSPLRSLRSPGRRVVGYVKRLQQWYVSPAEVELLPGLEAGERSPLFHIPPSVGAFTTDEGRFSWFIAIATPASLGAHVHPLGRVMRLETSAALPLAAAVELADQTASLLPRLASSPTRDARAPHNLTPVGALEDQLTHRLGDRRYIARLLAASVAATSREEALA